MHPHICMHEECVDEVLLLKWSIVIITINLMLIELKEIVYLVPFLNFEFMKTITWI